MKAETSPGLGQQDIDASHLGVLGGFVDIVTSDQARAILSPLHGNEPRTDVSEFEQAYRTYDARRLRAAELTSGDREIAESLRDAMSDWFFDASWTVKPADNAFVTTFNGPPEDAKYFRLLLPAQIMNQLTKLVESGKIEDVPHDDLIELSDYTYTHTLSYFTPDYFNRVANVVSELKGKVPLHALGFDLQTWLHTNENPEMLSRKAHSIFEGSYDNTRNYFRHGKAAGLYFMKSVVIAEMQKWHQERYGITDMIPSIVLQDSDSGHTPYNFQSNTTQWGDMHTNNKRFPFQRYVADYLETFTS